MTPRHFSRKNLSPPMPQAEHDREDYHLQLHHTEKRGVTQGKGTFNSNTPSPGRVQSRVFIAANKEPSALVVRACLLSLFGARNSRTTNEELLAQGLHTYPSKSP